MTAYTQPALFGALVKRPPTEVAEILRRLHGLGLRRLHGFGVKGVALDMAGGLLESVDSAAWAAEAMRRGGLCEHGNGIRHETNCPEFAQAWGEVCYFRHSTIYKN